MKGFSKWIFLFKFEDSAILLLLIVMPYYLLYYGQNPTYGHVHDLYAGIYWGEIDLAFVKSCICISLKEILTLSLLCA